MHSIPPPELCVCVCVCVCLKVGEEAGGGVCEGGKGVVVSTKIEEEELGGLCV